MSSSGMSSVCVLGAPIRPPVTLQQWDDGETDGVGGLPTRPPGRMAWHGCDCSKDCDIRARFVCCQANHEYSPLVGLPADRPTVYSVSSH